MLSLGVQRYEAGAAGLPARAIVFTNSERATAACARRWWFAEVEGLRTQQGKERPLRYGEAWAQLLEDVHRWWLAHDSPYPEDAEWRCAWCVQQAECLHCSVKDAQGHTAPTRLGPVARTLAGWQKQERNGITFEADWDAEQTAEGLRRALGSWFRTSGSRMPPDGYRVVGVECAFAAPVRAPRGGAYEPVSYVVPEPGGGLRLARTGEGKRADAQAVRWPWYQLGKLDALLQSRDGEDLLVWEGKSSADPAGYLQGLSIDPQVPGYVWLLQHHLERFPGAKRVAGYIYDVSSSTFQADPALLKPDAVRVLDADGKPLKAKGRNVYELDAAGEPIMRSPGLSRAAATTPSWRYEAAIVQHGFNRADYADHIAKLQQGVDVKLHVRDFGTVGADVVARYGREAFGVASRLATMRRSAATLTQPDAVDWLFPRTTVCRMGNSVRCAFRGPCLQDGAEARSGFDVTTTMVWREGDVPLFAAVEQSAMPDGAGELGW